MRAARQHAAAAESALRSAQQHTLLRLARCAAKQAPLARRANREGAFRAFSFAQPLARNAMRSTSNCRCGTSAYFRWMVHSVCVDVGCSGQNSVRYNLTASFSAADQHSRCALYGLTRIARGVVRRCGCRYRVARAWAVWRGVERGMKHAVVAETGSEAGRRQQRHQQAIASLCYIEWTVLAFAAAYNAAASAKKPCCCTAKAYLSLSLLRLPLCAPPYKCVHAACCIA